MQIDELKALIELAIPNCEIDAKFDGSHVHLVVVSAAFDGMRAVKRQQLVYGALQNAIGSGAIHAVHMKTYTPAERSSQV
jgi:acid stress-induced BolA-like protein IbaG/YrbA